jgi:hypothetical protein
MMSGWDAEIVMLGDVDEASRGASQMG